MRREGSTRHHGSHRTRATWRQLAVTRGGLAVAIVIALVAGACTDDSEPDAAAPTPTPASTATERPADDPQTDEPPASPEADPSRVASAQAFLGHLERGAHQELVALMTPAYRDTSFETRTAAQFWTFSSRFAWIPDAPTLCDEVAGQVECTWVGTDAVSRELGYSKRAGLLFSFDDGAISDIIYFANDSEVLVAFTGWVDENHPGEPACGATAEESDAYYGGAGVLETADGEVFGEACAARLVEHAAAYRDSGFYQPLDD